MMTSYFNLLKYAATGIAAPEMTAYDKLKALAMRSGEPKPVKMYVYVGTDSKAYLGTDVKVYASKKGAR